MLSMKVTALLLLAAIAVMGEELPGGESGDGGGLPLEGRPCELPNPIVCGLCQGPLAALQEDCPEGTTLQQALQWFHVTPDQCGQVNKPNVTQALCCPKCKLRCPLPTVPCDGDVVFDEHDCPKCFPRPPPPPNACTELDALLCPLCRETREAFQRKCEGQFTLPEVLTLFNATECFPQTVAPTAGSAAGGSGSPTVRRHSAHYAARAVSAPEGPRVVCCPRCQPPPRVVECQPPTEPCTGTAITTDANGCPKCLLTRPDCANAVCNKASDLPACDPASNRDDWWTPDRCCMLCNPNLCSEQQRVACKAKIEGNQLRECDVDEAPAWDFATCCQTCVPKQRQDTTGPCDPRKCRTDLALPLCATGERPIFSARDPCCPSNCVPGAVECDARMIEKCLAAQPVCAAGEVPQDRPDAPCCRSCRPPKPTCDPACTEKQVCVRVPDQKCVGEAELPLNLKLRCNGTDELTAEQLLRIFLGIVSRYCLKKENELECKRLAPLIRQIRFEVKNCACEDGELSECRVTLFHPDTGVLNLDSLPDDEYGGVYSRKRGLGDLGDFAGRAINDGFASSGSGIDGSFAEPSAAGALHVSAALAAALAAVVAMF